MKLGLAFSVGLILAQAGGCQTSQNPTNEGAVGTWVVVADPTNGVWRMNTKTGLLQHCYQTGQGNGCDPTPMNGPTSKDDPLGLRVK